jgi:hypothetical protein
MPRNASRASSWRASTTPNVCGVYSPPSGGICIRLRRVGMRESCDVDLMEHSPKEADELTCDGGGGHLLGLFRREPVEDLVEAMLAFPGVGDDGGILSLLAALEWGAHGGPPPVAPGGLDEDVSAAGVPGLGDSALPASIAG